MVMKPSRPSKHPLCDWFKAHGVPRVAIAHALGISPSWASQLLLGYSRPSREQEAALRKLKAEVEAEALLQSCHTEPQ